MNDFREKRDLYDKNRNVTGEAFYKGDEIPPNRYILVMMVFIKNSKGEFLIQKRSVQKDGKYGFTGGHAKAGETSLQGMQSEISEEIGLNVNPQKLELIYSGIDEEGSAFYDLYYLHVDLPISSFVLQKEEVDFVQWSTIAEIKEFIQKDLFLDNHAEAFERMLPMLETK